MDGGETQKCEEVLKGANNAGGLERKGMAYKGEEREREEREKSVVLSGGLSEAEK